MTRSTALAGTRGTSNQAGPARSASYASSFATKPNRGGRPAALTPATTAVTNVTGMTRPSPPRAVTSRVPASWSTDPATMNSGALYSACASKNTTSASPAYVPPIPMSITIVASATTVEYAKSALLSRRSSASAAATTTVTPPTRLSVHTHSGTVANTGAIRASRYTPALTMVAEWRYADTGVGAAMALGNQKWNGNWADFVNAPSATSTTTAGNMGLASSALGSAMTPLMEVVPVAAMMSRKPASMANPPPAVTSNACRALARLSACSCL